MDRENEKTATRVARAIAREMAAERLEVGTVLEDEKTMASTFGVGRNSVREALRLLEAQGMVELRRGVGGGPVVAAPDSDDFGKTLTMFLQTMGTSFRELADALAALEGFVAGLAATKAASSDTPLDELVSVLHNEDLALHADQDPVDDDRGRVDPFAAVGVDFHRALQRFVGNDVVSLLVAAIEGIWTDRTKAVRDDFWGDPDRARVHGEHLRIFSAIKSGDAAMAQELMANHITHEANDMARLQPDFMDRVVDWR